jgi:DNA-directed RNA polymerase subunit M/transcription elongation factor TFIIS
MENNELNQKNLIYCEACGSAITSRKAYIHTENGDTIIVCRECYYTKNPEFENITSKGET